MSIERGHRDAQRILGLHEVVPMAALTDFFGRAYGAVGAALAQQGAAPLGPPVALYGATADDEADVTAGFPVPDTVTVPDGLVGPTLPAGPTVETIHTGPYDTLGATYESVMGWFAEQRLTPSEVMWEEYLVGPDSGADPSAWQTRIVFPLT